jgi:hypothetical protein
MAQRGAKELGKRETGASFAWIESFRKPPIVLNEVCGEACGFCEETVADWFAKPILNETCMQRKNAVPCGSLIRWFRYVKFQFIPHREYSLIPLEETLGQIYFWVLLFSPCQFHYTNAPYPSSSTRSRTRRTNRWSLGTFQKATHFRKWGILVRKVY